MDLTEQIQRAQTLSECACTFPLERRCAVPQPTGRNSQKSVSQYRCFICEGPIESFFENVYLSQLLILVHVCVSIKRPVHAQGACVGVGGCACVRVCVCACVRASMHAYVHMAK